MPWKGVLWTSNFFSWLEENPFKKCFLACKRGKSYLCVNVYAYCEINFRSSIASVDIVWDCNGNSWNVEMTLHGRSFTVTYLYFIVKTMYDPKNSWNFLFLLLRSNNQYNSIRFSFTNGEGGLSEAKQEFWHWIVLYYICAVSLCSTYMFLLIFVKFSWGLLVCNWNYHCCCWFL